MPCTRQGGTHAQRTPARPNETPPHPSRCSRDRRASYMMSAAATLQNVSKTCNRESAPSGCTIGGRARVWAHTLQQWRLAAPAMHLPGLPHLMLKLSTKPAMGTTAHASASATASGLTPAWPGGGVVQWAAQEGGSAGCSQVGLCQSSHASKQQNRNSKLTPPTMPGRLPLRARMAAATDQRSAGAPHPHRPGRLHPPFSSFPITNAVGRVQSIWEMSTAPGARCVATTW